MKAALLHQVGEPLSVEDVDLDGPREGEVRIRVQASGLCHSDHHLMVGHLSVPPLPAVLGHEAAGIVEAVGEGVRGIRLGDHVVTSYASYCGHCADCLTGYTNRCDVRPRVPARPTGSRLSLHGAPVTQAADIGGFAEEIVVDQSAVVVIPEEVGFPAAALLGCAVITGVGAAIHGANVRPGSSVVVVGCGGVGLNVIQGARLAGAETIVAVDIHETKLAMAKRFGATHGVISGPEAVSQVREITDGGTDFAFEVIGLPSALRDAFSMLCKHGTLVVVGMPQTGAEMSFPVLDLMWGDLKIITSGMGDAPFQLFAPQLARAYLQGRLQLDELVSRTITLNGIDDAYAEAATGAIARSVITF